MYQYGQRTYLSMMSTSTDCQKGLPCRLELIHRDGRSMEVQDATESSSDRAFRFFNACGYQ
jgi:hypothetical protein